jgi:flagellar motor switch protein FliN/FliY
MAEDEDFELDDLTDAAGQEGDPSTNDVGVEAQASEAAPGNNGGGDTGGGMGNNGGGGDGIPSTSDLDAVYDIPVQVSAVLGKSTMQVNQLLKLGRGAVVELDRKVGEAIDIYVNNRLVARGEVVVVDERLGVTMTEIIKADRR